MIIPLKITTIKVKTLLKNNPTANEKTVIPIVRKILQTAPRTKKLTHWFQKAEEERKLPSGADELTAPTRMTVMIPAVKIEKREKVIPERITPINLWK